MLIKVLKSKARELTITEVSVDYEGSLILDPALIEALNMIPYEHCEVNSKTGTGRISTYVVPGNPGDVIIAGGAANHFTVGEKIHVNCFGFQDEWIRRRTDIREPNRKSEKTQIVTTDPNNKVTDIAEK